MNATDHAHFTEWDAAYVLGALSPADRREFEDHLGQCERCQAGVAELMALPGLLGRIDEARAFALLDDADRDLDVAPVPGLAESDAIDLVSRIRVRDRAQRMRRTFISIAGLAAAAALASVLTLVLPSILSPAPAPDSVVALAVTNSSPVPITASVTLTRVDWGTRLDLECDYHPSPNADGGYGSVEYSLWVTAKDGKQQSVSTWTSAPGSRVLLSAGTGISVDDLARIDLRTADGSQILLSADLLAR